MVFKAMLLLAAVLMYSWESKATDSSQKSAFMDSYQKRGKVLSLFSVVQFNNVACQTTTTLAGTSSFRNGTCYSTSECMSRGGAAMGSCAAGFGVCCLFIVKHTSTNIVSENCSYIQNPSFPSAETAANGLSYTVNKCTPGVCYLRLDFEAFTLQGVGGTATEDEGICADSFTVTSPSGQVVPEICGQNTGQHIYVDIGANFGDSASISFSFDGTTTQRTWDIKITQIECRNPSAPPNSCLQYFTGLTGRFTTFNFIPTGDNHLNDQQYSACIRSGKGFCCVMYQVCSDLMDTDLPFTLDGTNVMTLKDDSCITEDFIGIAGATGTCSPTGSGGAATQSRFCGNRLNFLPGSVSNSPVCDCTPPFLIDVYTNGYADGHSAAGFMNGSPSRAFLRDLKGLSMDRFYTALQKLFGDPRQSPG